MLLRLAGRLCVLAMTYAALVYYPAGAAMAGRLTHEGFNALPPARSIRAEVRTAGGRLRYIVTVVPLTIRGKKGETIGEVVATSYRLVGERSDRPVTFALNGGPGVSSVFLNLGLMGPKTLAFGGEGNSPSDAIRLRDNPLTWLRFTDLVFIDPIATGYSRTHLPLADAKSAFFTADADIEYLSGAIYDWLDQNGRLPSPKFIVGESYGGYRAPRLAHVLQTRLGVGVNGLFLISPYLDGLALGHDTALSPLSWSIGLVGMAADNLERQGIAPSEATMAPIEAYARRDFFADYLAGPRNKPATDRLSVKVARLIGLPEPLVRQMAGRVDSGTYLRAAGRPALRMGAASDPGFTRFDPFPERAETDQGNPVMDSVIAPMTSAMIEFLAHDLNWHPDGRYEAHNRSVNEAWQWDNADGAVQDLRRAMATDPAMTVVIAHGWSDLVCGYFGSRLILDQMPNFGNPERLRLLMYGGGHMFYSRAQSRAAFTSAAAATYAAISRRSAATASPSK